MKLETSRIDPNHFNVNHGCGCHFVAWKLPQQRAETYGWHLCPDHMARFQAFRQANRREFRIKHSGRCYYVVWNDVRQDAESFGWHLCPAHVAEYQRFERANG